MPYYSVRVVGRSDARVVANELSATFRGRPADYTGAPFFYVERTQSLAEFSRLVRGVAPDGYKVTVEEITREEYDWKKHQ